MSRVAHFLCCANAKPASRAANTSWTKNIMVISQVKIKKLIQSKKLVEGLGKRDLENPEGAGLDLRLDELFKIKGQTSLV